MNRSKLIEQTISGLLGSCNNGLMNGKRRDWWVDYGGWGFIHRCDRPRGHTGRHSAVRFNKIGLCHTRIYWKNEQHKMQESTDGQE